MGYIEKTLGEEEAFIAQAHFHWLYHVFCYGVLVLCLALASYLYAQAQWPMVGRNRGCRRTILWNSWMR